MRDVYLDVDPGEFICLLGSSGCGKATLLRIIAGLEQQDTGQIVQDGRDISALPPAQRDFGIVFQSYVLVPNLTAAQNVAYGLENTSMNYQTYLTNPALSAALDNSFFIAIATTVISVVLGFGYAYALTRTAMPGKRLFRLLALLPLYIPPLAHAIGLVYLFGNQGLVTTGFQGLLPGWDIQLYGPNGIIIGEVLYCFPQATLILITALSLTELASSKAG